MLNHTYRKLFSFLFLAPYARTTRYEEAFLHEGKNGLGRFAPSALPHYYRFLLRITALLCCSCLHIKPFFLRTNDISSTPSVLPDFSS